MQGKISRLKSILIIGTIILFIAGTSFLSVKSMDNYVKTITMGLIGLVFYYLSYYEEKKLNFKGTSIFTYVFASLSIFFTYATIGFYNYFGKWFSILGDGALIFLASLLFFIALLLLISSVKYKVYKLIELSIWITIIGISFIIGYYEVDGRYILSVLLGIMFIKNIVSFNEYSRWLSFVLSGVGVLCLNSTNQISTIIIGTLICLNAIFILFKNEREQIIPILLTYVTLGVLSVIFKNSIIFLSIASLLEIVLSYTKTIKSREIVIISKVIINIAYLMIITNTSNEIIKYIIPAIIVLTSVINIFISKDSVEEYLLPFKAIYFTTAELYYLPIDIFKEYLIIFVADIVAIFMYFLLKKSSIKYINIGILGLINVYAITRVNGEIFPNVVYLILFALDFYIIYVSEEKSKLPLSILFAIYSVFLIFTRMTSLDYRFALCISLFYLIFVGITRKNKLVFSTSVIGFILSSLFYFKGIISDATIIGVIANILVLTGIALIEHICMNNKSDKVAFIAVTIGIQIIANLMFDSNIVFKVFALVEAISLIALSIKDDAYKGLYIEGLIFVVFSILNIIGTVGSVPKVLYLIIIGLSIVLTTPLLISKYLKLQAEMKEKEEKENKKKAKEIKKITNKTTNNKLNFCPECGTKLNDEYIYCSNCGEKVR